jgi:hypothetical protein
LTELIPRLSDLCFTHATFDVSNSFVVNFVKLHNGDWRPAQAHWERIVEKVLETDAVERTASGQRAMKQAVAATVELLERTELRSQCPLCTRHVQEKALTENKRGS